MGKMTEDGGWIPITQAVEEARWEREAEREKRPPTPTKNPKPPAQIDPGPNPDVPIVDEWWIEEEAKKYLPDVAAFKDYAIIAEERIFAGWADQVIDRSGINLDQFADEIQRTVATIAKAERDLNTKEVPEKPSSELIEWDPLPGVNPDPVCTSQFDVNDLALRGRKSVQVRRYVQPLILNDAFVGPSPPSPQSWLFGQRLEYQQEWRHEGFTLGELISSMSLLPGEELAIEVSSWQRTKAEIEQEQDQTTRQQLARIIQCAPRARFTSGGRIHPDSCR